MLCEQKIVKIVQKCCYKAAPAFLLGSSFTNALKIISTDMQLQ